jgi:hypothetical protein
VVPLTDDERTLLARLRRRLDTDTRGTSKVLGFTSLDAYYNAEQRLRQLGLAVPDDLRDFVTIVGIPGTLVDAIEERCDVEGFRLSGQPEADAGFWEVWTANDLEDESQLARLDSLVFGRGYACVGTNEDDPDIPLVTVESPLELVHEWSPRDRRVTAAARFYQDESSGRAVRRATLYQPDSTTWLVAEGRGWEIEDQDPHGLGRCPVVPFANRTRTHARYGRSEMGRVIGLTDAAARALTNAQIATEIMALPQRYAAGMSQADFTDPATGQALTAWEAYLGAVWTTTNKDAKFGQFQAADLANFKTIVDHYMQLAAGVTGLPLRYFGQLAANPPSAEGIRADEARLVKTCERKASAEGASWARVMRLVNLFRKSEDDPTLSRMEVLYRDPATPTKAQAADAGVKLYQAGITTRRQARRDQGYSSVQIANMELDDADEALDPIARQVLRETVPTGAPVGG